MRKSILLLMAICLIFANPVVGQKGGLLKKVTKSMTDELLGKPAVGSSNKRSNQPEPACACTDAVVAMDLGGKLQLDYAELTISVLDDGRILAKSIHSEDYYVVKDGVIQGPYKPGDSRLADFGVVDENDKSAESLIRRYKPYISQSGEKYLITFGGKTYGPYAQISNFTVSKSKDKFAAIVIENIVVNEDQGKKMDAAIKNARTEQEKMDLAMQYTQQMQQKMMEGGGPTSMTPKIVTNIPGATLNPMTQAATFNPNIKFDDILVFSWDKVMDLQGKVLVTLKQEFIGAEQLFVNTNNTKYAVYKFGTLTFSDNKTLSELFSPYLTKVNGQVYIAYMYYSPKKNAMMQCKIPF
jgi:hypothetical protein